MALPELDVARVQRWCAARRAGARPPPSPRRVPGRPAAPHDRRAARSLARGLRAGMGQLPNRAPGLHRRRQVLDLVLARPQPPIYDLLAPSNRVDDLLNEIDRDPTCISGANLQAAASRQLLAPAGRRDTTGTGGRRRRPGLGRALNLGQLSQRRDRRGRPDDPSRRSAALRGMPVMPGRRDHETMPPHGKQSG